MFRAHDAGHVFSEVNSGISFQFIFGKCHFEMGCLALDFDFSRGDV